MKKYRFQILGGIVFLVLLKIGWDHRPWKKEIFQGYVEGEYVYVATPTAGRLQNLEVHRGDSVVPGQNLFRLMREGPDDELKLTENAPPKVLNSISVEVATPMR